MSGIKTESEKILERKLFGRVKRLKGLAVKVPAIYFCGVPDRFCLLPGGKVFFAEIKTTGVKPKKLQLAIHEKLRKLGFRVEVIDNSEQIDRIMSDYEK